MKRFLPNALIRNNSSGTSATLIITRRILFLLFVATLSAGCSQQAAKTGQMEDPKAETGVVKAEDDEKQEEKQEIAKETPSGETSFNGSETALELKAGEEAEDSGADIEETAEESGDDEFSEFDEFEEEFGDVEEEAVSDPFEGYNRFMTGFNDKLYVWVLNPVAKCYRWILPECVRRGIDRFFTNLLYPVRAVNNLLQGKLRNTGEETLRFVTNSTIGLLGFFDPAKEWFGLEAHDEDFGQTLGFYGIGSGPHIVLPFFGPSNLRDTLSLYPDYTYLDPAGTQVETTEAKIALEVFETVNYTSLHIGEYESLKKDAFDFYTFLRDSYEQKRQKEIEE